MIFPPFESSHQGLSNGGKIISIGSLNHDIIRNKYLKTFNDNERSSDSIEIILPLFESSHRDRLNDGKIISIGPLDDELSSNYDFAEI
jgi:sorbitol-specific phosphotransferase system component IIA